jgi:translation initiation factor IF-3
MPTRDAIKLARDKSLDLIEISPNAEPPVCKIMEYGKFKYEQTKREKLQKKNTHVIEVKELQFHPNIEQHDVNTKLNHARKFFQKGYVVKIVMIFSGREITHLDIGQQKLDGIIASLADVAKLDNSPKLENKQIVCILKGIKISGE